MPPTRQDPSEKRKVYERKPAAEALALHTDPLLQVKSEKIKVKSEDTAGLFAVSYSLFAIHYSLFAVSCWLYAQLQSEFVGYGLEEFDLRLGAGVGHQ